MTSDWRWAGATDFNRASVRLRQPLPFSIKWHARQQSAEVELAEGQCQLLLSRAAVVPAFPPTGRC